MMRASLVALVGVLSLAVASPAVAGNLNMPRLSGDVGNSGLGGTSLTIAPGAVTASKMSPGAAVGNLGFTPAASIHNANIVDDGGAAADTLRLICTISTTQGQSAFSFAPNSCHGYVSGALYANPLSSFNVGKNIILAYAGASLGTAPITGVGTLSSGSGYLDVPKITVSDATGSGALLFPNMELNTVALISGGAGCTTGLQTFALTGGTPTKSVVLSSISIASPGVLTFPSAAPPDGTAGYLTTAGDLPTGYVPGTTYFIINSSGSTASLSASLGGAPIVTSGSQSDVATFNYQAGQITGTVSGGALSGALTISVSGLYTAFRSPANVLNPQSIALSGGGCTSPPFISATFDVASVTKWTGGQNYTAPTATFSDGNATLTGLTIATPVGGTLATEIASVADGLDGTLAALAGSTLTGRAAFVVLGGKDNHDGIQAVISGNASPSSTLGGSDIFVPPVQPDYCFGVGSSIALPSKYVGRMRGAGPKASIICATAAFTGLLTKDDTYFGNGWSFDSLSFDGDKAANKVYSGGCDTQQYWTNTQIWNAAPLGIDMQIGDNDGCAGGSYRSVYTVNDRAIYTWPYDGPLIGKHIQGTDTYSSDSENIGAMFAGTQYDVGSAGGHCIGCHDFTVDRSTTCFDIVSHRIELIQPECDVPWISAINIHQGQVYIRGGSLNTTATVPYYGVLIDNNLNHVHVDGFSAIKVTAPENRVFWNGLIGLDGLSINPGAWPSFGPNLSTVLCQGAAYAPPVSSSAEVILADCPVPAGIIGRYGSLEISSAERLTGTGTTGTTVNYRLGNASTTLGSSALTGAYNKTTSTWTGINLPISIIQNATCPGCQINGSLGFFGGVGGGGIGGTGWLTQGVTDFYITGATAAGDTMLLSRFSVVLHSVNQP